MSDYPADLDTHVTIEHFAVATHQSARTVARRINSGEIRAAKIGRRTLIPRSELDRVLRVEPNEAA